MEKQMKIDDLLIAESKAEREKSVIKHPSSNTGAISASNSNLISKDISIENKSLKNSNIFIDWLSCTIPVEKCFDVHTGELDYKINENTYKKLNELKKIFKANENNIYQLDHGAKGYSHSLSIGENIKIFYGSSITTRTLDDDETIYIEISGSGCREVEAFIGEEFSWQQLIKELFINHHASFTRIDFSCDIFTDEYFTLERLLWKLREFHYTSPVSFLDHRFITEDGKKISNSCYVGSLRSSRYLLIYDKLQERKAEGNVLDVFLDTWIRFEMRFKQEWAKRLAMDLIETKLSVPELFKGCLYDFLDIKVKSRKTVTTPCRLKTWSKWNNFLDHVSKIKLSNQFKKESNLMVRKKWFKRCVSRYLMQSYIANDDFEQSIYEAIVDKIDDFTQKDLVEINSYLKRIDCEEWTMEQALIRLNNLKEEYEKNNNPLLD